jgi:hypothetical protein
MAVKVRDALALLNEQGETLKHENEVGGKETKHYGLCSARQSN